MRITDWSMFFHALVIRPATGRVVFKTKQQAT